MLSEDTHGDGYMLFPNYIMLVAANLEVNGRIKENNVPEGKI